MDCLVSEAEHCLGLSFFLCNNTAVALCGFRKLMNPFLVSVVQSASCSQDPSSIFLDPLFTHLGVDYNLQVHSLLLLQPLDCSQREPQVIGVEDLKLGNWFEFIHVGLGDLCDLQQTQFSFILDQCATLETRVDYFRIHLDTYIGITDIRKHVGTATKTLR